MDRQMFYRFEHVGASPRPGGAGFGAYLTARVAAVAASTVLDEKGQTRMVEICKSRLQSVWSEADMRYGVRISFFEGTWLPLSFQVPGDAATLDITWSTADLSTRDGSDMDLQYSPHNIDHFRQAFGLMAMFSAWAEYLDANVLDNHTGAAALAAAIQPAT